MNTDLHKRLEKISESACHCRLCTLSECRANGVRCQKFLNYRAGINDGFQLGYKEAIKAAKEWLGRQGQDWWEGYGIPFSLAYFETDMNKLLEE